MLLLFAVPLYAEERIQLPTAGERKAADIASYVTVAVPLVLDVWACRQAVDPRHCYVMAGVRDGATVGRIRTREADHSSRSAMRARLRHRQPAGVVLVGAHRARVLDVGAHRLCRASERLEVAHASRFRCRWQ